MAMLQSVEGYAVEPYYFFMNLLLFTLAVFAVQTVPGPFWLYFPPCWVALWLPTIVVASYIRIYKSPFNFNTFYFIWGTNGAETMEFARECLQRLPSLPIWIAAHTLLPLLAAWGMSRERRELKKIPLKQRWGVFAAVACALFALGGTNVLSFNYAFNFYYTYARYQYERNLIIGISDANKTRVFEEEISASAPPDAPETYVVVIGESASRHHWGTYDYPRNTTPLMSNRLSEGEIFQFNNVNSTYISTTESLLCALTFMDQNTSWEDYTYSIVDVFNGAGFETYWFSNNAVLGIHDTLLQVLSRNASRRRFSEPKDADLRSMQGGLRRQEFKRQNNLQYDSTLLPWLEAALAEERPKKVIFLHLKGSHGVYEYRYPDSFERFGATVGIKDPAVASQSEKASIVNAYDNSILYTDFLLDSIVKQVEAKGGRAWVFYFSDHADDIYDLDAEHYGRNIMAVNKYMLDVPFIVWFSEEYKRGRDTSLLRGYADRPYRLDDAIHSIIDIAGLKTQFFDPSRSIFSPLYLMRARGCFGKLYLELPPLDLVNPRTVKRERELNRLFSQGIGDL
jgi:heptose-I-phosphate ethanolaminephosphotransferase